MDVAILLAQAAVADQRREAQVEQLGEGAGFGTVFVGETRPVQAAEDGGELLGEDALEVGVFLVGAYDVRSGGEREGVFCDRGFGAVVDLVVGWLGGCHGLPLFNA